ncbi:MAG: hypothetical protein RMM17_05735 [Acidobacteriota bacterium]|nr:hypothetical protein [Blastocatellia bacterium]MDW8412167.1 hypothetical protein [Acidobacteriota bacterium]
MQQYFRQNLLVTYKGKTLDAKVVDCKLLNPGDRFSYTKRDSNPIVKLKVIVPALKVYVYPQIEITDDEVIDRKLPELVALCLSRNDTEPCNN